MFHIAVFHQMGGFVFGLNISINSVIDIVCIGNENRCIALSHKTASEPRTATPPPPQMDLTGWVPLPRHSHLLTWPPLCIPHEEIIVRTGTTLKRSSSPKGKPPSGCYPAAGFLECLSVNSWQFCDDTRLPFTASGLLMLPVWSIIERRRVWPNRGARRGWISRRDELTDWTLTVNWLVRHFFTFVSPPELNPRHPWTQVFYRLFTHYGCHCKKK